MNNLSIQLIVNPQCQLVAVDNTKYVNIQTPDGNFLDDITKHVSLEFLVYLDNDDYEDKTLIFKKYLHNREEYNKNITVIDFPKDGTFTYYKLMIPTLEHLIKDDGEFYTVVKLKDQTFYHKGKFYLGLEDTRLSEGIEDFDKALKDIKLTKDNVEEISNYLDIYKKQGTQTFSYQKIIFSVCKLQNCLVNLQKQILMDPNSCSDCSNNTSIRYKRDFLLSALYVLDYLKDRNNYDEAQRILDNLSSCGDSLCGDILSKNDCGCGSFK